MRIVSVAVSAFLSLCAIAFAQAQEKLTVYTYESFTADWGPGPQVRQAFQSQCACEVEFVSVADGVALLNRLKLEGEDTRADIVLGLDTNLIADAKASGLFVEHGISLDPVNVPGGWQDDYFVPYDYGYFAVVYNSEVVKTPPGSLKALVEGNDNKIVIQDPRTSTPGLGLLLWIKSVYGQEARSAWEELSDRILTVTPGWSESYGLFTSGEAPMVLSYTTSPAYHMIAEDTDKYQAAEFEEGHYLQIEVAGKTVKGAENPLAEEFLEFMVSPAFQDIIPETNWMYPAAETNRALNPAFDKLVKPSKPLLIAPEEVAENRKKWVDEWLSVMSQ